MRSSLGENTDDLRMVKGCETEERRRRITRMSVSSRKLEELKNVTKIEEADETGKRVPK